MKKIVLMATLLLALGSSGTAVANSSDLAHNPKNNEVVYDKKGEIVEGSCTCLFHMIEEFVSGFFGK